MASAERDLRIARLALVLVKLRLTGEEKLLDEMLAHLDADDLRAVLREQTSNAARMFGDTLGEQMADLAGSLGTSTEQVISDHFDALVLGLAAEETEQG